MELWGVYIKPRQVRLSEPESKELVRMAYTTTIGKHDIERIRKGERFITSPAINARIKQVLQQSPENEEFFKTWWCGEMHAEVRLKEKKIITGAYDPLGNYEPPRILRGLKDPQLVYQLPSDRRRRFPPLAGDTCTLRRVQEGVSSMVIRKRNGKL